MAHGTRKKEHMEKVRLTNKDLRKGNTLSAEKRTGKEDGGLARRTVDCQSEKHRDHSKRERIKAKKRFRRN